MNIPKPLFKILVKTGASENTLEYDPEKDLYRISLKARAENNQANLELIKFLSNVLGKQVRIKSGLRSKEKFIQIIHS